MTRIAILKREDMNEEQRVVYDDAKAAGRPLGGPYFAYIRIPELMRTTQEVGASLADIPLTKREQQIAILTIARFWNAKYPWAVQVRASLKVGLDQEIIDALNAQTEPPITDTREILAHKCAQEMLVNKGITDATYAEAEARLFRDRIGCSGGEDRVIRHDLLHRECVRCNTAGRRPFPASLRRKL